MASMYVLILLYHSLSLNYIELKTNPVIMVIEMLCKAFDIGKQN